MPKRRLDCSRKHFSSYFRKITRSFIVIPCFFTLNLNCISLIMYLPIYQIWHQTTWCCFLKIKSNDEHLLTLKLFLRSKWVIQALKVISKEEPQRAHRAWDSFSNWDGTCFSGEEFIHLLQSISSSSVPIWYGKCTLNWGNNLSGWRLWPFLKICGEKFHLAELKGRWVQGKISLKNSRLGKKTPNGGKCKNHINLDSNLHFTCTCLPLWACHLAFPRDCFHVYTRMVC